MSIERMSKDALYALHKLLLEDFDRTGDDWFLAEANRAHVELLKRMEKPE